MKIIILRDDKTRVVTFFIALEDTSWRVSGEKCAAKMLGMKQTPLESRIKKPGINRPQQANQLADISSYVEISAKYTYL